VNREIKRRTKVATMFPNADSCLRLVTAVVSEISDEWIVGNRWLNMDPAFKFQVQFNESCLS